MRNILLTILFVAIAVVGALVLVPRLQEAPERADESASTQPLTTAPAGEHVYWTWNTMEFDKCVAAWMISRFVDREAVFRFHEKGTANASGTPFDVPGTPWSRQHMKCTSDCVLESLGLTDPALVKIVEFAHHSELNRWQLDQFPEVRGHFERVREILDAPGTFEEYFARTGEYFDRLYAQLASDDAGDSATSRGSTGAGP